MSESKLDTNLNTYIFSKVIAAEKSECWMTEYRFNTDIWLQDGVGVE